MQSKQTPQSKWPTSRHFILQCSLSFLLAIVLICLHIVIQRYCAPQTVHDTTKDIAEPAQLKEQRDTNDAHITSSLLANAEHQPAPSIETLATMQLPWAKAWAGFLLIATHPNDAMVMERALRLQEEARIAMGRTPQDLQNRTITAEEALLEVRLIGEDTPDSRDVPCWIAYRWPSAWVAAFDAIQGDTRDGYLPQCDPPLDSDWIETHGQTAIRLLGPGNGFCGSLMFAERRTAFVIVFRAWYLPRTLLTMLENSRNNRIDVREELLEVLHRNIALRNRYIHAVQPSAAWRRSLMKHLYTEGLSPSEVTTVMEVTEATMESNMISAELRCGRETN